MSKRIDIIKEIEERGKSKSEEILLRFKEENTISVIELSDDLDTVNELREKELIDRESLSYSITELGESVAEDIETLRKAKDEE